MKRRNVIKYGLMTFIVLLGAVMIYPILWMMFATVKTNAEIFGSTRLLPEKIQFGGYLEAWAGTGKQSFLDFFRNTMLMVVPTTVLTVLSSSLVAYGFSRFEFRLKKPLLGILIATLLLPNSVLLIPRYSLYNSLHILDSYIPFYLQAILSCNPFFVYMMIQFIRGIPKELDEAAYVDGCGTFDIYRKILIPLIKPSLVTVALFQFMWTYNDYLNPLIYLTSVTKYPLSLALRLSMDAETVVNWSKIMAMSFMAILPLILLFFFAQKYFVEGIAASGLKG